MFYKIIFSPTGGTERCLDLLIKNLDFDFEKIDLLNPNDDYSKYEFDSDDVVFIGVPSFSGRVPETATNRLSKIKGHNSKAIILVSYGNREFEDTLIELRDIAKGCGFDVICGVSTIAEHSIARQFGKNRPDEKDEEVLEEFSFEIFDLLGDNKRGEIKIPGNIPYKEYKKSELIPSTNSDCIYCGICIEKCPTEAIDKENPFKIDPEKCIACMRCISVCPVDAKEIDEKILAVVSERLSKVCSIRKEPELFL